VDKLELDTSSAGLLGIYSQVVQIITVFILLDDPYLLRSICCFLARDLNFFRSLESGNFTPRHVIFNFAFLNERKNNSLLATRVLYYSTDYYLASLVKSNNNDRPSRRFRCSVVFNKQVAIREIYWWQVWYSNRSMQGKDHTYTYARMLCNTCYSQRPTTGQTKLHARTWYRL